MSSRGEGRDGQGLIGELVSLLVMERPSNMEGIRGLWKTFDFDLLSRKLLLFDIARAKDSLDVGSVGVTHMGVAFLGSQSTTILCLLMKSIPMMTSYVGDL